MKLNDTLLCLNCDVLFERHERQCPFCASQSYFPISPWLNRMKTETVFIVRSSCEGQMLRSDSMSYKLHPLQP